MVQFRSSVVIKLIRYALKLVFMGSFHVGSWRVCKWTLFLNLPFKIAPSFSRIYIYVWTKLKVTKGVLTTFIFVRNQPLLWSFSPDNIFGHFVIRKVCKCCWRSCDLWVSYFCFLPCQSLLLPFIFTIELFLFTKIQWIKLSTTVMITSLLTLRTIACVHLPFDPNWVIEVRFP